MTQSSGRPGRLIVLVLVLLAVVLVLAVVLRPSDRKKPAAAPPPTPGASPSASPTPSPSPSPSPTKVLPYPWFAAGTCLDTPQLDHTVDRPQTRPCDQPHDAQAVANPLLPDGLTRQAQIEEEMQKACRPYLATVEARQPGKTYYSITGGPPLAQYQQGLRDFTCEVAAAQPPGGQQLTGPLQYQ